MLVCGQSFSEELIERIQATVKTEPLLSRRALSRRVCQWLSWRGPNGKLKEMSARVALKRLGESGVIRLPKPVFQGHFKQTKPPEEILNAKPTPIGARLGDLGAVELVLVGHRESHSARIWKALMARDHYLGAGPLCGAQLRYVIKSAHWGWLGALAFSAAAWRVGARDQWIGWDEPTRARHLGKVIGNTRFLISPHVHVPHLASHVLARALKRVGRDWRTRYGYTPLLVESYVERERFAGTCYRAANWIKVGVSTGRGRQDRDHAGGAPIKDVYLYPLAKHARHRLCQAHTREKAPKALTATGDWASQEFGGVALGDARLTQRAVRLARDFYAKPLANIPQACGSRAKTKAAYRFFDHPRTGMEELLSSHYQATAERIGEERVVLAVQDTTALNYTAHPATANLGPIGSEVDGAIGLWVHDTLAFTTAGTPLGLVDVQCWARDPKEFGKHKRRYELPIEQKESHKWLTSFSAAARVQKHCPQTTVVSVGDREADIYELFMLAEKDPRGPKLLIRAERKRLLAEDQAALWACVRAQPQAGIQALQIPRRAHRAARLARLAVRFAHVTLRPPKRKPHLGAVRLWAVLATEIDAPPGAKPLEWMLLTTLEVSGFEGATERLAWYALRWGIEVYHRTLKSGCRLERRQLGHADRIESCLAIDMVVAWRIHHLTKLGRETPAVPCSVFFEEHEWKALVAYVNKDPTPPENPPTLRQATHMVGTLGGFLGRKGDGEPGTQALWLGLQRLDDLTAMWKVLNGIKSGPTPAVSSKMDYG
ncbi:MAG: hypothetical protein BMS9Abin10_0211 [Gammaproteobacteria bacterium]|nr:MAG: hypothetical protein BMS9Abin10_0211 [Gammaproteobacteria bacterium]